MTKATNVDPVYENQIGVKSINDYLQTWLNEHVHHESDGTISSFETIAPASWEVTHDESLHGTFRDIQQAKADFFGTNTHGQKEYLMVLPDPEHPGEYVSYTPSGIRVPDADNQPESMTVPESRRLVQQIAEFSDLFLSSSDDGEAELSVQERLWRRLLEVNHLTPFHLIKESSDAISNNRAWERDAAKRHLESVRSSVISQPDVIDIMIRDFATVLLDQHDEVILWRKFNTLRNDYQKEKIAYYKSLKSKENKTASRSGMNNAQEQLTAYVRQHSLIEAAITAENITIPALNAAESECHQFIENLESKKASRIRAYGGPSVLEKTLGNFYNEAALRRHLREEAQPSTEPTAAETLNAEKAVSLFRHAMLSEQANLSDNRLYALRQALFFYSLRPLAMSYKNEKEKEKEKTTALNAAVAEAKKAAIAEGKTEAEAKAVEKKKRAELTEELNKKSEEDKKTRSHGYDFGAGSDNKWGQHRNEKNPDLFALLNSTGDKNNSGYWFQPSDGIVKKHHDKMGIPFLGGFSSTTKDIVNTLESLFGRQLSVEEYWHFALYNASLMVEKNYHSFYEVLFIAAAFEPAYLYQDNQEESEKLGHKIFQSLSDRYQAIGQRQLPPPPNHSIKAL